MKLPDHHDAARRRAGFSLVELAVVTALLGVVLSTLALVTSTSERVYLSESITSHLESQVAITMEQLVSELRVAGVDTLAPEPLAGIGATSLDYLQATSQPGGAVDWSSPRRLVLEYEPGEIDDGLDNNGNELIDECRLVLIEDPDGPNEFRRVLTRWVPELLEGELPNGEDDNGNGLVDERGFTIERLGQALRIHLTLERRTSEGVLLHRTARSAVFPRNRLENEE